MQAEWLRLNARRRKKRKWRRRRRRNILLDEELEIMWFTEYPRVGSISQRHSLPQSQPQQRERENSQMMRSICLLLPSSSRSSSASSFALSSWTRLTDSLCTKYIILTSSKAYLLILILNNVEKKPEGFPPFSSFFLLFLLLGRGGGVKEKMQCATTTLIPSSHDCNWRNANASQRAAAIKLSVDVVWSSDRDVWVCVSAFIWTKHQHLQYQKRTRCRYVNGRTNLENA